MAPNAVVVARVERNLERVWHLLAVYAANFGEGRGRRDLKRSDILRAATVLLHATLEDFLRSLAAQYLPGAGSDALDSVPLVGRGGRPEKFFLGALADHRGKTVDDLLRESVQAHLERETYNNMKQVASLLASIGVEPARVNIRFDDLEALMERRHQIVHQADKNPAKGSGHHGARSISVKAVTRWFEAVEAFVEAVQREL